MFSRLQSFTDVQAPRFARHPDCSYRSAYPLGSRGFYVRASSYGQEEQRYQRAEVRTSEVGTRFGKVSFRRAVGRVVGRARGAADLPLDRALGLCSGFSLGVVTALGKLCAQMAYTAARVQFKDTYDWAPSPRATLRMVDALGAEARGLLEQAPAPDEGGEIVVIQVDGKGVPMISAWELRRRS